MCAHTRPCLPPTVPGRGAFRRLTCALPSTSPKPSARRAVGAVGGACGHEPTQRPLAGSRCAERSRNGSRRSPGGTAHRFPPPSLAPPRGTRDHPGACRRMARAALRFAARTTPSADRDHARRPTRSAPQTGDRLPSPGVDRFRAFAPTGHPPHVGANGCPRFDPHAYCETQSDATLGRC